MDLEKLKEQLIADEGRRNCIYSDLDGKPTWPGRDKGNPTFGIGHKLTVKDPEWYSYQKLQPGSKLIVSDERIDEVFNIDIDCCVADCRKVFDDFQKMLQELQLILANMMFNLGYKRFLGFHNFILAINSTNYLTAAIEMKDSDWYNEVTNRADRLRKRIVKLALTRKK